MPTKKKPSAAQLAARAKFVAMVRAKSKAKKSATKKISGTKKKATKLPSLFDKPTSRQTGTSNKVKDAMRKALAPGKRKSATGKSYTERRANRSDKPGSLLGIKYKSAVRIYFKNPKYNYTTDISNQATEESCKSYFVGKYFNVGIYPKENLQKCIRIKLYKYLVK